jgi:hypothetical protein
MDNAVIRYVFDRKKNADSIRETGLLQIEVRLKSTNRCVCISTGIHLYILNSAINSGNNCIFALKTS